VTQAAWRLLDRGPTWLPTLVALALVDAAATALVLRGSAPIALAILTAAPIVALSAKALVVRPQRGVLLLAALVPFNGLLLIAKPPSAVSAWKEALVATTLVATFVSPSSARAPSNRGLPGWTIPLGAFLGLSLASSAFVGGLAAIVALKIGFYYLLVAWTVWRCPLSARERDRLMTIIMGNALITAVIGIVQEVVGPERLHAMGWDWNVTIRFAGSSLRSFSTFNQPFPFAMFLMMACLVGLPVAMLDPRRVRNRIFLLSLPILLLALGSTIVRGAYIGLGVGLLFLGLRRGKYVKFLLPFPVAAAALLLLPAKLVSAALSSSSGQQRTSQWRDWIPQLLSHPLGSGIGTTGSAAEKVGRLAGNTASQIQTDNYFYKVLFELGILGLWLFLVFLVTAFLMTYRAGDSLTGFDAVFADGVAASIVAAATACLVATYFEMFPMDVYFWLLLGVVTTCSSESGSMRSLSGPAARASPPTFANC
jgi:O-Antigen ligase